MLQISEREYIMKLLNRHQHQLVKREETYSVYSMLHICILSEISCTIRIIIRKP